jgi:hypothetical protein
MEEIECWINMFFLENGNFSLESNINKEESNLLPKESQNL